MKKRFNNKGFTLVELIVVIAVLAVITVVAAPQYLKYVEKARIGTDENAVGEIAHAAEVAYVNNKQNNNEEYVSMQIRINSTGGAIYQAPNSELVKEVKEVVAEDSYTYKSELYRGKTVEINIDPETGIATWLPPRLNWTPSHNGIVGDILTDLGVTDEQKDQLDIIISNAFNNLDEFTSLGENGMVDYIEGALNDLNNGTACVATGSLVTLADGSVKKVEELLTTDKILAFDHENGEYVEADILVVAHHGDQFRYVMNLEFSNGSSVKLVDYHGLFDTTLNKYVYLTNDNFTEFKGHEFAMQSEAGYETAVLENAFLSYEYTGAYAVVTDYYMNCFTNGFFSIIPEAKIAVDAFEYGADLKFDTDKMLQDIETYGLYEYEEFSAFVSEEVFNLMPFKYVKVTEGKGLTTMEEVAGILKGMSSYLSEFGEEATYIKDFK